MVVDQALDKNDNTLAVVLETLKAFNRICYDGLLHMGNVFSALIFPAIFNHHAKNYGSLTGPRIFFSLESCLPISATY